MIYKYPLNHQRGIYHLYVPVGSTFLCIKEVDKQPVAYFDTPEEVEGNQTMIFKYCIEFTGFPNVHEKGDTYLGTLEAHGLIVHYYETKDSKSARTIK